MENGLERLNRLNPVSFDWKETGINSEGFIAHEVQEVFADVVTGQKDGKQMQTVDYGRITPLLVKAIQEQQETNRNTKSRSKGVKRQWANTKVTSGVIKDDAVGADQLASNSVVTASINDNAITTAKIADDAILTAKISNSAITNAKMSAN